MKIWNLNPDQDIGATAWFVDIEGHRLLMDAGVHPRREGREGLPVFSLVKDQEVDAIAISHCHHDHVGALPVALRYFPPAHVLMTELSYFLVERVLHNSVNVMTRQRDELGIREYPLFTHDEVDDIAPLFQGFKYNREIDWAAYHKTKAGFLSPTLEFYDAGHAPMLAAAAIAATIASGSATKTSEAFTRLGEGQAYPLDQLLTEVPLESKIPLVQGINDKCFARSPLVSKVTAQFHDEQWRVMIVTSDGIVIEDLQPKSYLAAMVLAEKDGRRERASWNLGGRRAFSFYTPAVADEIVERAVDRTLTLFEAVKPPAGEMPVVLGPGITGILLHEAIGHGMAADFNRKGISTYATMIGRKVRTGGHDHRRWHDPAPQWLAQLRRRGDAHEEDRACRSRDPDELHARQDLGAALRCRTDGQRAPGEPPAPHPAADAQYVHAGGGCDARGRRSRGRQRHLRAGREQRSGQDRRGRFRVLRRPGPTGRGRGSAPSLPGTGCTRPGR